MDQKELLDEFFSRKKEYAEFKKLRKNPSGFDIEAFKSYINDLCNINYGNYLDYIYSHSCSRMYVSTDFTQASSLEHCRAELCEAFERGNDEGLGLTKIGKLLYNDNIERNNNTENRYGRDQTLTGGQLGLTQKYEGKWYLSCIGKVYLSLDDNLKDKIVSRCVLRDPLYFQIILEALNKTVDLQTYVDVFDSKDTQLRRKSSIRSVLKIVIKEANKECPNRLNPIN